MQEPEPDETRAEVARRRLAQLAASFDAEVPPPPDPSTPAPAPHRATRWSVPSLPVTGAHLRVVVALGIAAAVVLGWMLLSGRPEASDAIAPVAVASPGAAKDGSGSAELVVDVIGKVRKPGIVTVPRGSRVYQAIEAAGGLAGKVDTSGVNLARVLDDGEQIIVGAPAAAAVAPGGGAPVGKISRNTATLEQLDTLPGVGPVTAQAILAWRDENGRFATVDDLLDVKGIGDATFADLKDLVTP